MGKVLVCLTYKSIFSFLVESSDYKFHNLLDVFQIPLIMGLSDLVALFLIKVGVGVHEWLDLVG